MAGYSKTPLVRKLGIKPGHRVAFVNAPSGYDRVLGALPGGCRVLRRATRPMDVIQVFSKSRRDLERRLPRLDAALAPDGMIWISWPTGSSGVATDLTGGVVREIGLEQGLVDVKVCAVAETWSGLKFVIRVKDRAARR